MANRFSLARQFRGYGDDDDDDQDVDMTQSRPFAVESQQRRGTMRTRTDTLPRLQAEKKRRVEQWECQNPMFDPKCVRLSSPRIAFYDLEEEANRPPLYSSEQECQRLSSCRHGQMSMGLLSPFLTQTERYSLMGASRVASSALDRDQREIQQLMNLFIKGHPFALSTSGTRRRKDLIFAALDEIWLTEPEVLDGDIQQEILRTDPIAAEWNSKISGQGSIPPDEPSPFGFSEFDSILDSLD